MAEFLEESRLSETPGTIPTANDRVANLPDDHEQIISSLRDDSDACAEKFNEEGTAVRFLRPSGFCFTQNWALVS